jgi:LacI family transcriptional regulator, galactose operon repressor
MTPRRRHRVADIAAQSGLSRATVDRVLHERPGVRPETVAQVERALAELDRQRSQVHLSGRTLLLDLVMQAPDRFASASQAALEARLRSLQPAVVRVRSHLREESDPAAAAVLLGLVAERGSDGVILKAPDDPRVVEAVGSLAEAGIPVVTYVTDLPTSRRVAYAGADNAGAGATAAYLVHSWAGPSDPPGTVMMTLSSTAFRGEDQRATGFREALARLAPDRRVVEVTDTDGLDGTMLCAVHDALVAEPSVTAVYSVGGGNVATLAAFDQLGRQPAVFVAHDLDSDNRALLRSRRISAVLHHDLGADLGRACRLLLQARGLLPGSPLSVPSQVQVVTPYNEPAGLDVAGTGTGQS